MLDNFTSVHRWCITGTPISSGLDNMEGLISFLEAWPYANSTTWRAALDSPFNRLRGLCTPSETALAALPPNLSRSVFVHFLAQLTWRNQKSDVADELRWGDVSVQVDVKSVVSSCSASFFFSSIPKQTIHVNVIKLDAVSRYTYNRLREDTRKSTTKVKGGAGELPDATPPPSTCYCSTTPCLRTCASWSGLAWATTFLLASTPRPSASTRSAPSWRLCCVCDRPASTLRSLVFVGATPVDSRFVFRRGGGGLLSCPSHCCFCRVCWTEWQCAQVHEGSWRATLQKGQGMICCR